jgi:hypothetical protein
LVIFWAIAAWTSTEPLETDQREFDGRTQGYRLNKGEFRLRAAT